MAVLAPQLLWGLLRTSLRLNLRLKLNFSLVLILLPSIPSTGVDAESIPESSPSQGQKSACGSRRTVSCRPWERERSRKRRWAAGPDAAMRPGEQDRERLWDLAARKPASIPEPVILINGRG